MRKKVWIFGDSYADPAGNVSYAWPIQLSNKYDVTNFALGGTGPTYSLNLLKSQHASNDVSVIFLVSAVWRLDLKFLKPSDQHILVHLHDNKHAHYKKYFEGIKFILDNYVLEPSFKNTELDKIIGALNLYSKNYEKLLVWPVFHETKIPIENTSKFTLVDKMMFNLEPTDNDNYNDKRVNHLSKDIHYSVFHRLSNWIDNGEFV